MKRKNTLNNRGQLQKMQAYISLLTDDCDFYCELIGDFLKENDKRTSKEEKVKLWKMLKHFANAEDLLAKAARELLKTDI